MENIELNPECTDMEPQEKFDVLSRNPETNYSENNIVNNENDMQEKIGSIKESVEMERQINDEKEPIVNENTAENDPEGTQEKEKKHKCGQCEKAFSRAQHLRRHIDSVHEGQKNYNCEFCVKVFSRSDKLIRHINNVHDGLKNAVNCELCDKSFYGKKSLKKHIKAVHEAKIQPKIDVEYDGDGNEDFVMNGTEEYNPWAVGQLEDFLYFCCPECDVRNQSKELFLQHAIEHPLAKETLHLLFGLKTEPFEEDINFDQNNEDNGDNSLFYPAVEYGDENDTIDNSKKTKIKKKRKRSDTKPDSFNCSYCEKTFGRNEHLKRHVNSVHEGEKFDCTFCEKSFSRKDKLKIHLKYVHRDSTIPSTKLEQENQHNRKNESQCVKVKAEPIDENDQQMNRTQLEYQNNIKHEIKDSSQDDAFVSQKMINEPLQTFVCETCGKEFSRRDYLKAHIMNIHEHPRKCKVCDETFMTAKTLRSHISDMHPERVHEVLKKYTCDLCGQQFTRPSYLKKHIEVTHEGKRPHSCEFCGKSFSYRSSVIIHIKSIHEGDRYQCEICQNYFTQPQALKLHIRNVHNKEGVVYGRKRKQQQHHFGHGLAHHHQ